MAARRQVLTQTAPNLDLPLSQGIVVQGPLLFISGQAPIDPETLKLISGGFEEQADRCFANIKAIIQAAGGDLGNTVKVNAYLRNMADFPVFNDVYRRYLVPPWPARTTVQSNLPDFLIEVDVVVAMPE